MTTTTQPLPRPATEPLPLPAEQPPPFPPSAEFGELLQGLEHMQIEIDRKKAEELARLRAIQDRD